MTREMRLTWRSVFVCTAALWASRLSGQTSEKDVTLIVTEKPAAYALGVPVSRLAMTIPKETLRIDRSANEGAATSPRYFSFASQSPLLLITGWFESADGFSSMQSFWSAETAAWKLRGLPTPQNVSFVAIGHWNAVLYDLGLPAGRNTNIRAHWVQAGTWIDIHLSLTADLSSDALRTSLRRTLESIVVTEKAP